MQFNKFRERIINYPITGVKLYYVSFLSLYLIWFFKATTYADFISDHFLTRLSYLIIGVLLAKIYLFDDFRLKRFIANTALVVLAVIVWRKSHAIDILIFTTLVLGARGVNFRLVMDWFFKIGLVMVLFTIISSQIGLIKDLTYLRGGVTRHSMGVNYPTDFGAHILYLILAYCYLDFKKISWKSYGVIAAIALLLMVVTQARLDVYAIILTIVIVGIAQLASKGSKLCRDIANFYWIFPILLAYIAFVSAYFYDSANHLFKVANRIFSERLYLSHQAIDRYGVRLFGNLVSEQGYGGSSGYKVFNHFEAGPSYFYIDSSFIRLLVIYGIVTVLVIVGIMTVVSLRSIIGRDYRLAAIMVVISVSSLIEPHLLDISFNPFLIALFATNVVYRKVTPDTTEVS